MKSVPVILAFLVAMTGFSVTAGLPAPQGTGDQVVQAGGHGSPHGAGHFRAGAPGSPWSGLPPGRGGDPGRARHGQERDAGERAREELRRDPADRDILGMVRRAWLRGYRRISGSNVLDHEARRMIHDLVICNPGIDLQALSQLSGIPASTVRYHLHQLTGLRKISVLDVGGVHRFYENHGRYDQRQKKVLARLWYVNARKILDLIRASPGISRGEIAGKVGISGPSATRWLKQFLSDGIVHEVRDGRFSRYYPAAR